MDKPGAEIKHFTNLEHIWWGAKTPAGQKRYDYKFKLFKNFCRPIKGSKVLEIGCGDGEFSKRLVRIPSRIFATDITPAVVKRGEDYFNQHKHKKGNITFKIEDAERLSFSGKSFDVVCGVSILHHINAEKALKEALRVLKPKGQIFFTEPNYLNPVTFLGLNTPFLRKKMEYSPGETALTRWQVEKLLKKIGYKKVLVKNYDFLFPKTPEYAIDLVEKIGKILERMPLVKEISGSLIIWAEK
jgi:dolichol-phosphate mannosyltransferase